MDKQEYFKHLLSTLSTSEKLFIALRYNRDLRNPTYMTFDPQANDLLVFCTKQKTYLPILDELGQGCTNCKLASNIRKVTQYVNEFRSNTKKVRS